MKIKTYVWATLILLFSSVQAAADKSIEMQSALESTMQKHKISDLSVSVIRSGKTFYMADLHLQKDDRLKIGVGNNRYRIASISKLFTAQAILQLQEKGKLSLDDKASTYIPSLSSSQITIKDLLTHYAGLKDRVWPETFSRGSSFDTYLSKVLTENQSIQTGTNYQYSDTGFNILGKIISNVSKMECQTYIGRKILGPAGCTAQDTILDQRAFTQRWNHLKTDC
jgi:CubicO group peptidase (beta-lactamase class C family)